MRIIGATDVGIESFATDLAMTGVALGLLGDGQATSGNHTGLVVRRGVTSVRTTTFARGVADAVQVGAHGTLDLRVTPISKSWVGKTVVVTVTLSDNTVHTAELRVRLNRRHTGGHDR